MKRDVRNEFLTRLETDEIVNGKLWRVKRPLHYFDPWGGRIFVPEGFETDYASIPNLSMIAGLVQMASVLAAQWFWQFYILAFAAWVVILIAEELLHDGTWDAIATVHDWIYRTRCRSFWRANWILFVGTKATGAPVTPLWKRVLIYGGVTVGGWWAWYDDDRRKKNP